jgi:hypothetical protein
MSTILSACLHVDELLLLCVRLLVYEALSVRR